MKYKQFVVGVFSTNCYLITDENTGKSAIIDPGSVNNRLLCAIDAVGKENLEYILLTHGHFDHIGGVEKIRRLTGAKVAVCGDDAEMIKNPDLNGGYFFGYSSVICKDADVVLKDNDIIKLGDSEIKVIATPGHTSGGCCYYCEDMLFAGDTLFYEGCGRCDMATADFNQMKKSLRRLVDTLPDETRVFSGHGGGTTILHEKQMNPYLF